MGKTKEWMLKKHRKPIKGMGNDDFKTWFDAQSTKKVMLDLFTPLAIPILAWFLTKSIPLTIMGVIITFLILFIVEPAIMHFQWKKHISYREYQESRMEVPVNVRKRRRSK